MLTKLSYLVSESVRGFFYNKFMSFVVIANIAISLFFVSVFLLAFLNLNRLIEDTEDKITFEVFLEDKAPEADVMRKEILNTEGITDAEYISKATAFELFKKDVGSEILTAVDGNPLPASFKLKIDRNFRTPEKLERIRENLKNIPFVEDVSDVKDWVPKLQKIRTIFATVSLAASIILCLAIFFMVFSTIRVTYLARRELIRVLELVGASENAIKIPFIIEGALKGVLGGLLAYALLFLCLLFVRQVFPEIVMYGKILFVQLAMGFLIGCMASVKSINPSESL